MASECACSMRTWCQCESVVSGSRFFVEPRARRVHPSPPALPPRESSREAARLTLDVLQARLPYYLWLVLRFEYLAYILVVQRMQHASFVTFEAGRGFRSDSFASEKGNFALNTVDICPNTCDRGMPITVNHYRRYRPLHPEPASTFSRVRRHHASRACQSPPVGLESRFSIHHQQKPHRF